MKEAPLVHTLKSGGIAIVATDTLYGVVASAFNKAAVERVYKVKGRTPTKPVIILISDTSDLAKFDITLDSETEKIVAKLWPGQVSIILPCPKPELEYLHRGTNTLAFRLPNNAKLRALLLQTGPLIAPSANPEGQPPATTIEAARAYFGDKVDIYEDGGVLNNPPSTLISIENGKVVVVRQGALRI